VLVERSEQNRERRLGHPGGRRQRLRVREQALVREQLLDERVEDGLAGGSTVHHERRNRRFRGVIVAS
jgi:hypothetical protein